MSARVRRTIGMSFSPVRITQADDPSHIATISVNANQYSASDLTKGYHAPLAVIPPVINLIDHESPEQLNHQSLRQTAL
jgi:hypothetical protein